MASYHPLKVWPRGFTLIEIVIAMVLLSILGLVGANMINGSVYTNQTISKSNMAYASARYALERMSREIREMDNTGSLQISSALTQSQTLSFKKTGPEGQQTVTFTFSNGTLSMTYGNGTAHTLATNLTGSFAYYTDVGANAASTHSTTDPATLHYVLIRLQATPDPALNQVFTLSNLIYLRNT